jgi:hypothetical protein
MMTKTNKETGKVVLAALASPGPGERLGEVLTRPHFAEGRVVLTPARGKPQATAAEGATGSGGREAGIYPAPERTPEMNRRIGAHEIGHCLTIRAMGNTVHFVTIIPSGGFEGRCQRSGAQSSLNLLDETPVPTMDEIVDLCARIEASTQIGSSRVADAEGYIRAQTAAVELVAGRIAEQILFPDLPPLHAEHEPPRLFGICHGEVYEEPSRPYLVLHIVAQRGKSGRHLLLEE